MNKVIYLDNNSTTKIDDRVLEVMMPYFKNIYSNSSSQHAFGIEAKKAVDKSREQVAHLINANANEIIFTSCATEAINLGIKGFCFGNIEKGKHIITVSTEHKAVLDTCKYLEKVGFEVTYLPVQIDGIIDIGLLEKSFQKDTILVSVMFVNNEIGVIQDIENISNITHINNASFFCDATQAVGKIPIDVRKYDIDMMSFSAHKFYGPKGIGALYRRNKKETQFIEPIIHGGGHERGFRSGTLNTPGIVGLGKACEIAEREMKQNEIMIKELRDYLENELFKFVNISINGNREKRLFNISNICFKDIDVSRLLTGRDGIIVSNGSACSSATIEPSHVLAALGLKHDDANKSIRISLGKYNKMNDIKRIVIAINNLC